MHLHWYESFFQGLSVELWDAVTTPEMTLTEVNFFEQALIPSPDARILDVPCGGGRHAIELARRGYRMTGLDISTGFLAIARRNAAAAGVEVQWIQGNMLSLPQGPFDAAYCYGNSFGYLTHRDTLQFLAGMGQCVRPGGRFLLETGTAAETILPTLQPFGEYTVGGIKMETRRKYRFRDSVIESVYTFSRDGQVESHNLEQAVYTTGEICRMLEAAGFSVAALYSGTDGAGMELGNSRRLLVVAERTA
ncbi:MAG: methyltransferase domain-containing protein [Bryobacteraceae bacterium]